MADRILGYKRNGDPIHELKPGMMATACVISCSGCGWIIRGMGGPSQGALCPTCFKAPVKLLVHHKGLITGCKVLETDGTKVKVHVQDERHPKWVDLAEGKHKLCDTADQALAWIEEQNG